MLRKLPISSFTERLFGFTIPENGVIYACDHDESFEIRLDASPGVNVLDHKPYDFIGSFRNALGIPAGTPLHRLGDKEVAYDFDGRADFVAVTIRRGSEEQSISFRTLSGDWFVSTLSTCGKYVVLAEPYHSECYEFV